MRCSARPCPVRPVGRCIALGLAWLWAVSEACAQGPILLRDVTGRTGITFRHNDGSSGKRYIVESMSAGLALFDYDGDGDVDIYFVNGAPLPPAVVDVAPRNALYRNEGGWKFTDVTEEAGVGDTGYGLGVACADYDNDGDQDLYLNNFGPNVLYRNNGDGTFTDVTEAAGVANGQKVGAGACFLDVDRDGDLDLYVANYVQFSCRMHVPFFAGGFPAYRRPRDYSPEPDDLYRNNGDGTFTNVSIESGVGLHAGPGMGMVCADYDNDGDTDVLVCSDVAPNLLFENDGAGNFDEVGLVAGVAYNVDGNEDGSMGVDCGDYDNDGRLDFFMTNFQAEVPVLYRNLGGGFFDDVTLKTGAGAGSLCYVTWGNGFVDFDNDGHRDIFVACGHLQDNVELYDDTTSYRARNVLLRNTGSGRFVNVSDQCGDGLAVKLSSRGAAFDDLDNDGDVDVVILNSRQMPTLLRNDSAARFDERPGADMRPPARAALVSNGRALARKNHWIQIRLRGTRTNRDGVGAHVKVVAGDLTQIDEVHSGRGYQSHYGMRLHFGLGPRDRVDRIEVRWIGGGVDVLENVAVDRLLIITEGCAAAVEGDRAARGSSP